MTGTAADPRPSLQAWVRLAQVPGLRGEILDSMLARHGSAESAVAAPASAWLAAGASARIAAAVATAPDPALLGRALSWLAQPGHGLLRWIDPDFPPLLRQIPGAPVALFVHGDPATLLLPQLAIVGSRNATPEGRDNAAAFAATLAASGFSICSGLAEGIDAAAHAGALRGGGRTVAVCGTGLDRIYPAHHAPLAARIAQAGALVAEFAPGTPPVRHNFPRRNRIISGLSLGTLVIEAGVRSGALITAGYAGEQGREVFALPGSIHNPLGRGCHRLIRQGAKLVETAADVVEELGGLLQCLRQASSPAVERAQPDIEQQQLLAALGWDPVDMDTLLGRCRLTTAALSSMLLHLELEGHVRSLSGGRVQRIMRNSG